MNRRYDILLANAAAIEFFSFFAPSWKGKNNVAHLVFSADGLKPAMVDWPTAASYLVKRLRAELGGKSTDAQDEHLLALTDEVERELALTAHRHPPHPQQTF